MLRTATETNRSTGLDICSTHLSFFEGIFRLVADLVLQPIQNCTVGNTLVLVPIDCQVAVEVPTATDYDRWSLAVTVAGAVRAVPATVIAVLVPDGCYLIRTAMRWAVPDLNRRPVDYESTALSLQLSLLCCCAHPAH